MITELANLRIHRIITHQIFKRDENRGFIPPKCSTELTPLDQDGLNTLQDRVVSALGSDSHSIDMTIQDIDPGSAFQLCGKLLDPDDAAFKDLSAELTRKLALAQSSRKIPGGIVVVFTGIVGNGDHRYVGIIKAELHGGFSKKDTPNSLLLEYLAELLLTPQQKLYKIGIFIEVSPQNTSCPNLTPEDFRILVYDHNMTRAETRQAAQYFYKSFLGCTFSPSDKKLTSDFYYNTREFIESLPLGDEERLDLQTSLYTYLKVSQRNVIGVAEFAAEYLHADQRDNYQGFMTNRRFPSRAVTKDLTHIKYRLRRRKLRFTSDVRISAPAEDFQNLVSIKGSEDGKTLVAIAGSVEREES